MFDSDVTVLLHDYKMNSTVVNVGGREAEESKRGVIFDYSIVSVHFAWKESFSANNLIKLKRNQATIKKKISMQRMIVFLYTNRQQFKG